MPGSATVLRNATLANGAMADVRIEGGEVAAVAPAGTLSGGEDLSGYVLLPAPAEPHAHLDKALLGARIPNPRGDLMTAIEGMLAFHASLETAEVAARARTAALTALAHGATAVRSHVDCGGEVGLRCIEALVAVREEIGHLVDIQIVALVTFPTAGPGGEANRTFLREALARGADAVGGCPLVEPRPLDAIDLFLETAAEFGRPVDLHVDETIDPALLHLPEFAARVAASGFRLGATASHCVSLGQQEPARAAEVAAQVAEAGVGVVTLPATNLFLQARGFTTRVPRGITAVRPLLDAGAVLAGGGDNVRDPFNTMGRGDALETAALLVMAAHLTPEEAYGAVSAGARAVMGLPPVEVAPGYPADLLAVQGASLADVLAAASEDRLVVKAGRVVCRTTVERRFEA